MASRTCILMAILGFVIVHLSGLFQGRDVTDVWLTALLVMVGAAAIGFCLGWGFEALIKETLVQEEAIMLSEYLKSHPDARGDAPVEEIDPSEAVSEEEVLPDEEEPQPTTG